MYDFILVYFLSDKLITAHSPTAMLLSNEQTETEVHYFHNFQCIVSLCYCLGIINVYYSYFAPQVRNLAYIMRMGGNSKGHASVTERDMDI